MNSSHNSISTEQQLWQFAVDSVEWPFRIFTTAADDLLSEAAVFQKLYGILFHETGFLFPFHDDFQIKLTTPCLRLDPLSTEFLENVISEDCPLKELRFNPYDIRLNHHIDCFLEWANVWIDVLSLRFGPCWELSRVGLLVRVFLLLIPPTGLVVDSIILGRGRGSSGLDFGGLGGLGVGFG
jgi:hypothetical protein